MAEPASERPVGPGRPRRVSRSPGERWHWPASRGTVIEAGAPPAAPGEVLRIGLLTHSVLPRGGVVHSLELAEALTAAGHAVTLFAPAAPGEKLFRTPACTVEEVPVPATPPGATRAMVEARIAGYIAHLRARLAAGARWDLLHAHDGIGANALAELRAQGRIGPWLRTVHHLDRYSDPVIDAFQQRGVREADTLLCVSAHWAGQLARDWGRPAEAVPNGVDLQRFQPAAGPLDALLARRWGLGGGPVVLAVGGIEARKNTARLLEAFLGLRQARPGAQLLIAGGASLLDHGREVAAFRARLEACAVAEARGPWGGPGSPVIVTGPLPDELMPSLYRRADVMALPSLNEGFGLVVLEALASGCPVVVPQNPPFTEYLDPRAEPELAAAVSWCDPLAPETLQAALVQALDRPRPAPPAVCARYAWARSAERHLAVYRAHLARHAAPLPPHLPA